MFRISWLADKFLNICASDFPIGGISDLITGTGNRFFQSILEGLLDDIELVRISF